MNKLTPESDWFLKQDISRKLEKEESAAIQKINIKKENGPLISFFYRISRVELAAGISFALAKVFGLLSIASIFFTMSNKSLAYIPIIAVSLWGFFIVLSIALCIFYMRKHKKLDEKELYEKLKKKYDSHK